MPRLSPCPSCQSHVFANDRTCPHCGASLRASAPKSAAVLVGLALTGCPAEPEYGVPDTGTDEATESDESTETGTDDADSSGEAEYGVPDTGTDDLDGSTDIDGSTDSDGSTETGEPEYGVPDTGTETATDTGGEPLYGLGDSG